MSKMLRSDPWATPESTRNATTDFYRIKWVANTTQFHWDCCRSRFRGNGGIDRVADMSLRGDVRHVDRCYFCPLSGSVVFVGILKRFTSLNICGWNVGCVDEVWMKPWGENSLLRQETTIFKNAVFSDSNICILIEHSMIFIDILEIVPENILKMKFLYPICL